jgi:hypothetical protein
MRRSRGNVDGERKTSAVCHCHDFAPFTTFGAAHIESPFLAATNVPSIKHSARSSLPLTRRSSAKASRTLRRTPDLTQLWNLRWQVWYGGNLSGRSCQRAPVRKIQRIPLRTSRLSLHGLPRPSSRRGFSGISGEITAHCSSVNSSRRAISAIQMHNGYL